MLFDQRSTLSIIFRPVHHDALIARALRLRTRAAYLLRFPVRADRGGRRRRLGRGGPHRDAMTSGRDAPGRRMMPMARVRVDAPTPRRATLGGKTHRDASARVGRRPRATVTRGGRREASATTSTVGRAFSSSTSSPPMTRATRARALQTTEDTPVDAVSSAGTYDWRAHWYPVAFCVDLEEEAPLTFTLLGEPLVFWRDGSGEMRCVADRCPHRLVPLSEGRVNDVGVGVWVSRMDVYGGGDVHVHSANRTGNGIGHGVEEREIVRGGVPDEGGAGYALGVSDVQG